MRALRLYLGCALLAVAAIPLTASPGAAATPLTASTAAVACPPGNTAYRYVGLSTHPIDTRGTGATITLFNPQFCALSSAWVMANGPGPGEYYQVGYTRDLGCPYALPCYFAEYDSPSNGGYFGQWYGPPIDSPLPYPQDQYFQATRTSNGHIHMGVLFKWAVEVSLPLWVFPEDSAWLAEILHEPGDWIVGGLNAQIPVQFGSIRHCYLADCENASAWWYDNPAANIVRLSATHGAYFPSGTNSFIIADARG